MNVLLLLLCVSINCIYAVPSDTLRDLCTPVKPTAQGFSCFLKDVYNHPDYNSTVFPHDLAHVDQFLTHGKATKQPVAYAKSVLNLFSATSRRAPYINAFAFHTLLQTINQHKLLTDYFGAPRASEHVLLQEKINTLLYHRFMEQMPLQSTREQTQATCQALAQEICELLSNHHSNDSATQELRTALLIFLEIGLGKLIWSPDDGIATWQSVKDIADQVMALMEHNIITDIEDVNGLFIALLERYCFFLDVAGSSLPTSFYTAVKADIATSQITMLDVEEAESLIKTKKERLLSALHHHETQNGETLSRSH